MKKSKERILITFLALLVFSSMSVGYAIYGAKLDVLGTAAFAKNGKIAITNAVLSSHSNLNNPKNPTYNDTSISFDLSFTVARNQAAFEKEYSATYDITITNGSFYDYAFSASSFAPSLSTSTNTDMVVTYIIEGIELNEIIPTETSRTFQMKIIMYPNNYGSFNVNGDAGVDLDAKTDEGSLLASIPKNTTGDLTGNNEYVKITTTVVNSYKTEKEFTFSIGNNNFYLVDANGNNISTFTIEPNTTMEYDIYIKQKADSKFPTDKQSMNIYFEPTGGSKGSMGVIVLTVEMDATISDEEDPVITDVTSSFQEQKGNVLVSYNGSDNVGIDHYVIETYKEDGTLVSTNRTVADENSYLVTGLVDGSYYFKVYAHDASGNSSFAISPVNNFKWVYKVTITITNGSPNGTYNIDYNSTYSVTIRGNDYRNPPANLTITMGGEATNAYTYSASSGELRVPNVIDDLVITGTARNNGCLVKGTKIKLADGSYKNIEDIDYDDLILVWSYDLGKVVYEYPLWIENEHINDSYTKITFSDNSEIKVVRSHSFYSYDVNKFVNFNDSDNFHIGTNVAKLNENNELISVKVTDIEEITEEVNYYFVASTRYYNIISNDFITTDGYTDITNLYEFNNNISWSNNRIVKTLNYTYLKDILPYYMYKGFRAGELAILMENGKLSLNEFKAYLNKYIINDTYLKNPIMKNNSRYWMVTTSFDNVLNKEKYLYKEGSFYELPKVKGVKYYYSSADNKEYKPGSKVKIYTGMHFEAIK